MSSTVYAPSIIKAASQAGVTPEQYVANTSANHGKYVSGWTPNPVAPPTAGNFYPSTAPSSVAQQQASQAAASGATLTPVQTGQGLNAQLTPVQTGQGLNAQTLDIINMPQDTVAEMLAKGTATQNLVQTGDINTKAPGGVGGLPILPPARAAAPTIPNPAAPPVPPPPATPASAQPLPTATSSLPFSSPTSAPSQPPEHLPRRRLATQPAATPEPRGVSRDPHRRRDPQRSRDQPHLR